MTEPLRGIFLLCALYIPGAFLAAQLGIGVPGAVAGLLLCLVAMLAVPRLQGIVRPGALVMLGLVPLFLVPLLVRMALTLDFASAHTWRIVAVMAFCAMLGIFLCGLTAKLFLRGDDVA